jgi:hypothetical protein
MDGTWAVDGSSAEPAPNAGNEREAAGMANVHLVPGHEEPSAFELGVERRRRTRKVERDIVSVREAEEMYSSARRVDGDVVSNVE